MKHFHTEVITEREFKTEICITGDTTIDGLCYQNSFHEDEDEFTLSTSFSLTKMETRILQAMIQLSAIHNGIDDYLDSTDFLNKLVPDTHNQDMDIEKLLIAFNLFVVTACDYLELYEYRDSTYLYKYAERFLAPSNRNHQYSIENEKNSNDYTKLEDKDNGIL